MLIAPSILNADFRNLSRTVGSITAADMVHLDVMDGRFVPNITFGPMVVEAVKSITDLPLDVHLMIEEPERYVGAFAEAGATYITVHAEATRHLHRVVQAIREAGCKPGVAINPATSLEAVQHILTDLDLVLVMTVNPGFGGQLFIPQTLEKIAELRQQVDRVGCSTLVEVDGGINTETIRRVAQAGATVAVAGSFVFSENPRERIESLRKAAVL